MPLSPSDREGQSVSESSPRSLEDALPLSRTAVDRDYLTRSKPDVIDELLTDPSVLAVVLVDGRALLEATADEHAAPRLAMIPVTDLAARPDLTLYLGRILEGRHAETRLVAAVVDSDVRADLADDDARWGDLRTIGAELDALDAGIFTEALALANWHASHAFSPRTGEPTVPGSAGWVRYPEGQIDEASGYHVFPRTDPAVIVAIVDSEDRLLLGANARWAGKLYSVLAGFVEPGESFEAAVVREMFEESGLVVSDPVYFGSQPWPFPASIMVGFTARVAAGADTELKPDGDEIMDLRWVTRDEIADPDRAYGLPGRTSIARALIEDWFGGPIADGPR